MNQRRAARGASKDLRGAGERLIAAILADPAIVDAVSKTEIDRAVEAGELIPRERLMFAGGFEMAPLGRVGELEDAIFDAMALLEDDEPAKAMKRLMDAVPEPEPEPETESSPDAEPVPEAVEVEAPAEAKPARAKRKPKQQAPASPDAAKAADGRPAGMAAPGETVPCEQCGIDIDFEQSSMSYTRFRRNLCRPHHVAYDPEKVRADAAAAVAAAAAAVIPE